MAKVTRTKMSEEEKRDWNELCEYFKKEILGYGDDMKFPKFLALRLCVSAQTEIRELAIKMRDLVKEQIPFVDYKVMNCGVICNRCKGE